MRSGASCPTGFQLWLVWPLIVAQPGTSGRAVSASRGSCRRGMLTADDVARLRYRRANDHVQLLHLKAVAASRECVVTRTWLELARACTCAHLVQTRSRTTQQFSSPTHPTLYSLILLSQLNCWWIPSNSTTRWPVLLPALFAGMGDVAAAGAASGRSLRTSVAAWAPLQRATGRQHAQDDRTTTTA